MSVNCNYFIITNYNNVEEGYYRWTGCTDIISVSSINPLQVQYVCAKDLIVESYGAPLTISLVGFVSFQQHQLQLLHQLQLRVR